MACVAAVIEHKQGWASQAHTRYRIDERGKIARNRWQQEIKPKQKAEEFESVTGEKSAQRIAQERGHAVIAKATSLRFIGKDIQKGINILMVSSHGRQSIRGDNSLKLIRIVLPPA